MSEYDCPLCAVKSNTDISNTILFEDEYFLLTPSIGPLCVGHMLIISKEHCKSLAAMGDQKIKKVLEYIKSIQLKYNSSDILFAEHGVFDSMSAGNCINHTHIHVLPGMGKYFNILDGILPSINLSEISELTTVEFPYIFLYFR